VEEPAHNNRRLTRRTCSCGWPRGVCLQRVPILSRWARCCMLVVVVVESQLLQVC
jgi:hypothetical protein